MKYLFLLTLLILINCTNMNQKNWPDSNEFKEYEKEFKIKKEDAIRLYNSKFLENFKNENLETYNKYFDEIIYIQNKKYYIGYISKMDKKGIFTTDIYCQAEVDPNTGEITIIK